MKTLPRRVGLAAAALLPTLALAHTGAGTPHAHDAFFHGLLHPLTGLDHLAAMLALGVWSALAVRPAWLAPAAFVLLLATGALAGFAGLAVPAVEPMIAVSLLVIGLLLARRQQLPLAVAAALAGGFAFFHGVAHGGELTAGNALPALTGMLVSTALLHLAGMALGRYVLQRQHALSAAIGGAVALLGSALLLGLA
jgi:urease accessory protein